MKGLGKLWENAQQVAQRALRRADAEVYGTPRAQARYAEMDAPARVAMEETVKTQFGETAWDDFMRAVGGDDGH